MRRRPQQPARHVAIVRRQGNRSKTGGLSAGTATSAELISEVNQQIGQVDVQRFSAIIADLSDNPQVSIPNDFFNPRLSQSLDALSGLASDSSDLLVDIGDLQSEIESERTSIEMLVQSVPSL
jgi:hypothetical protein